MPYTVLAVLLLTPLDLSWTGRPRSIACALLRSGSFNALLDPGPAVCIPTLLKQLESAGLSVSDLHCIFLTHIHLDHAGAAGSLLELNPRIQVYVHQRGAPHMANPENLLSSAQRLYGDKMASLFGNFLPVPEGTLHVLHGGEILALGDEILQVLYTPGHASHHVTYFDPSTGTAFVGDTAGICIEGHPFILPATPPPDIHLELWDQSLESIAQLHPRQLFLTHFGLSSDPSRHLAAYRASLHRWSESVAELLATGRDDSDSLQEFVRRISSEATATLSPTEAEHYLYNGYLPLSWMGLARYQRKKAKTA
jgi:glyoxylase-like metal-dependent hydrolase (beta-lactamase superfamily II)